MKSKMCGILFLGMNNNALLSKPINSLFGRDQIHFQQTLSKTRCYVKPLMGKIKKN